MNGQQVQLPKFSTFVRRDPLKRYNKSKFWIFSRISHPKDTELSHFAPKILVNSALMRLYEI